MLNEIEIHIHMGPYEIDKGKNDFPFMENQFNYWKISK